MCMFLHCAGMENFKKLLAGAHAMVRVQCGVKLREGCPPRLVAAPFRVLDTKM